VFGSQRVARGVISGLPNSSVSVFAQLGSNQSQTLPVRQYYGGGATAFGFIAGRPRDSMGVGVGLSRLNPNILERPSELMIQAYYQAHLFGATFLQPTDDLHSDAGRVTDLPGALTTTLRLTVLF
jgi:porin